MTALPHHTLDDTTKPTEALSANTPPATQPASGSGHVSGPRSFVIRSHVPVSTDLRSGFIPISWTMNASGKPTELRYAHALYTLSAWCEDYVREASRRPLGDVLAYEMAAFADDLAHLFYDPKSNWWFYVAEYDFPVLREPTRHP